MKPTSSFSDSTCEDQLYMAERELTAFMCAVTELFGPEQARLSAEDWLDESESVDSPPRSTTRDWRAVTVAAAARARKSPVSPRESSKPVRPLERYQGIADTIVQLFRFHTSGVMKTSPFHVINRKHTIESRNRP